MIITISGNPGSGKSTIAKIIQKKLSAERIYLGQILRDLAKEKEMTLNELNEFNMTHPEIDREVDAQVAKKARLLEKENKIVIVEGRAQFHFLPESIKIYIKVDQNVGAERIWKDLQKKELQEERNQGKYASIEELKASEREREENDAQRYQTFYGIDYRQETNYDLIVDTTKITAETATDKILEYIKEKNL